MTIACKICKYAIRSPKPDVQAQADVMKKMGQHLGVAHREHAQELGALLATVQSLAATYLLFSYVEIPESEPVLLASYAENKAALMELLESYTPVGESAPTPAPSGPVN